MTVEFHASVYYSPGIEGSHFHHLHVQRCFPEWGLETAG